MGRNINEHSAWPCPPVVGGQRKRFGPSFGKLWLDKVVTIPLKDEVWEEGRGIARRKGSRWEGGRGERGEGGADRSTGDDKDKLFAVSGAGREVVLSFSFFVLFTGDNGRKRSGAPP